MHTNTGGAHLEIPQPVQILCVPAHVFCLKERNLSFYHYFMRPVPLQDLKEGMHMGHELGLFL